MVELKWIAAPVRETLFSLEKLSQMSHSIIQQRYFQSLLIFFLMIIQTSVVSAERAKIGVVIPLTGGASSNGQSIANSIKLAQEHFDPKEEVKFIFEDDQMQPRLTVGAVKKLISENTVDGLIVFGSPTSLAVNTLADSSKVPMIGMSVVDRVVQGKHFVVKHWVTAEKETELIKNQIHRLGYKTVAIVSTTNDAMLKLRDLFIQNDLAKVEINEEFAPNDIDFKTTALKIKTMRPDAVYVLLWAPQPGIFAKQLRQIGYSGPIFGAHNLEDPHEISASAGALYGAWYVTGDDRAGNNYYNTYKSRYGTLPANGGINGYDTAKMMIEGVASGDLNRYLHSVRNFEGAYGRYNSTDNNDFDIPAAIKHITSQGFKFQKE